MKLKRVTFYAATVFTLTSLTGNTAQASELKSAFTSYIGFIEPLSILSSGSKKFLCYASVEGYQRLFDLARQSVLPGSGCQLKSADSRFTDIGKTVGVLDERQDNRAAIMFGGLVTRHSTGNCATNFASPLTLTLRDGTAAYFYLIVRLTKPILVDRTGCQLGPGTQKVVQYYDSVVPEVASISDKLAIIHAEPSTCLGLPFLPTQVVSFGSSAFLVPARFLRDKLGEGHYAASGNHILTSVLDRYQAVVRVLRAAKSYAVQVKLH